MIHVTLKDGSVKEFENGTSVMEIVKGLGAGLYKAACACKVNGELCDLRTVLNEDCALEVLTFDSEEGRRAFNHTASHILAQAVKRLYPNAKLAIGPAIADGFYYDIDVEPAFGPEELEKIEAEMHKIVKEAYDIERFELDRAGADALMADEPLRKRRAGILLQAGRVHRPVRWSSPARHRPCQGCEADPDHRRLLERRCPEQDAVPCLWRSLPQAERAGCPSEDAGRGQEA